MKTKILAFTLVLLTASFSLTACTDKNDTNVSSTESTTKQYSVVALEPSFSKPFLHENPSDVETSTELTTEPETITKEAIVCPPPETNIFISNPNLKSYIGKKLTDLEKDGFEFSGYTKIGDDYDFYYTHNNMGYKVQVAVPSETDKILEELDSFDGDKEAKVFEMMNSITITKITTITDKPLSNSELSKYEGKNASVLIKDGFEQLGYYSVGGSCLFEFKKGNQVYQVTFSEDAEEVLSNIDFESYETEILNLPIKNIEYGGPTVFLQ